MAEPKGSQHTPFPVLLNGSGDHDDEVRAVQDEMRQIFGIDPVEVISRDDDEIWFGIVTCDEKTVTRLANAYSRMLGPPGDFSFIPEGLKLGAGLINLTGNESAQAHYGISYQVSFPVHEARKVLAAWRKLRIKVPERDQAA